MRIWSYSPQAQIKYRKGIVASIFWAVAIPTIAFFACKWGYETEKIPLVAIFFIGLVCIVMPFQILGSMFSQISKEKLKSLYVFLQDEWGNMYYIYLSSDAFLDETGLRSYQMDGLRYHNFIFKMIQNHQNNKNKEILLTTVRDNHLIENLYQQGRLEKVVVPIHRVVDIKKQGNHILVTFDIKSGERIKKRYLTIYKVIDNFDDLYENLTIKCAC